MKTGFSDKTLAESNIIIHYSTQRDGFVFRLHPLTLLSLQKRYPERRRVDSLLIGYDKQRSPEQIDEGVWQHISQLLTGLSSTEIEQVGGFSVIHPVTQQEIYHSALAYA
ncbi:MAG: hypothetical protein R3C14_01460 [Caldilineaceae bacterium]